MKAFLAGVLAVLLISTGAMFVLEVFQRGSDSAFTGPATRIDVPGAKPKS